ncbi:MAG TPA: Crp/Fnr family transcriptional regulator [Armatimonadota bacterium]
MPKLTRDDIPAILRRSGFFGRVSEELLAKISRMSRLQHYDKGELIFAEDTPCTGMYIVGSGAIKVYKIGPDGREHVLHVAETGETFGEAALFLGSAGYPAYAGAVKSSDVVFTPKREMLDLLSSESTLCLQVLASLAMWTHRLVTKLEILTLKDASSRLAGYFIQRALEVGSGGREFELSIPKSTLAAHLAISSETLSRLLNRFEAQGFIESEGRLIRILDSQGLQEVADLGAGEA